MVLTCPQGTYAKTMTEVRQKMTLTEVGIQGGIKTRTAATGALILEIPGTENTPKADALAARIREILQNREGYRVDRPVMTAELRIKDLEGSITIDEVKEAVAEKAGCQMFEVQVGTIRRTPRGHGTVWVKLPLAAAKKVTVDGYLRVGWSKVRVEILEKRPLRCFRCFERGHVKEKCTSDIDRSGMCYRCGSVGHISKECIAIPKCPLCSSIGRQANHVLGSKQCSPQIKNGRVGGSGLIVNKSTSTPIPSTSKESADMLRIERNRVEEEQTQQQFQEQPLPQRERDKRQRAGITIENMEVETLEEGGSKESK